MVRCPICNEEFKRITNSHLSRRHNLTGMEFSKRFPNAKRGIIPWSKGKTKMTHPSLAKLSWTLKQRKEWNFSEWQKMNKGRLRRIREKRLKRSSNLAELMGIILGDGNLVNLPRTEGLRVVCNFRTTRLYKSYSYINAKDF